WNRLSHSLRPRASSGIWQGFIPGLEKGANYKYQIASRLQGYRVEKADPLAFAAETPPRTASIVCDLEYAWGDEAWMKDRRRQNALTAPVAVYEVHLGSWMRMPEEGGRWLTYRELAPKL